MALFLLQYDPTAMGWFVTKIRNCMSDKTLDALISMRQFYQKPKQENNGDEK